MDNSISEIFYQIEKELELELINLNNEIEFNKNEILDKINLNQNQIESEVLNDSSIDINIKNTDNVFLDPIIENLVFDLIVNIKSINQFFLEYSDQNCSELFISTNRDILLKIKNEKLNNCNILETDELEFVSLENIIETMKKYIRLLNLAIPIYELILNLTNTIETPKSMKINNSNKNLDCLFSSDKSEKIIKSEENKTNQKGNFLFDLFEVENTQIINQ